MKKIIIACALLFALRSHAQDELPLVVIVPSYNNEAICHQNLFTILAQKNYSNYRVIYINDCSSDSTMEKVSEFLRLYDTNHKVTVINNTQRRGAMANICDAVHSCDDNEIVLLVDGDDCLAHGDVFTYINNVYKTEDVWVTYGQYVEWPNKTVGFNEPFSQDVIKRNAFREGTLPVSHMRTFYAWLFKRIKKEDLMINGDFFVMTCDKAMMAPMLEMAGFRHKCITDILYIYNNSNPINDHRVNKRLQMQLMYYILYMQPYQPLAQRPV